MDTKPKPSPEFSKFDQLVGQVLSVPKSEIQRRDEDKRKPKAADKRVN